MFYQLIHFSDGGDILQLNLKGFLYVLSTNSFF